MPSNDVADRLAQTQTRIASAAIRAGRRAESVALIAISKRQPTSAMRELAALGQLDFGENYLQEALPKMRVLADLPLTWHFTGQIQSNKTRPIAEHFAWVHTLAREQIATRLNEQRPAHVAPVNVCLQVRLADEEGKGGVTPAALPALAAHVRTLPRLRLRGLMALPPPHENFDEQKAFFDQLARLRQELNGQGFELDTLSMGMSGDLEAAVAAGATQVRIGTALFGERRRATTD